jgi:UDP-glucose 4-epimerase
MVLPRFVQSALANEPITIYGDGSQSRVFCHVHDAIKAILTLSATDSTIGDVFNVGGIGETTMKELAEKIIKQTNSTSTITYTPYIDAYPAGFEDMQRRVPDITKIKKTISWQPEHTLASIIDDVARSMRG